MTVIERAARALAGGSDKFDALPLDKRELRELQRHGYQHDTTQSELLDDARAVLQAIREPSEGMVEAGQSALEDPDITGDDGTVCIVDGDANAVYRAMIDAALSE